MRLERMLTDALREEAEDRDVDVARLWAETRDRLGQEPPRRARRRPAVLAAAAAAAVVVGVAGLTQLGGPDRVTPSGPAEGSSREGDVADDFTCPEQVVHDWTRPSSVVDKQFVATLHKGLEFQARGYDVPRYELEVDGDRAFAGFGNVDGSLALRSEFHREDGEWVRFRSEVCTGEDGSVAVPVEEPLELRNHLGSEPVPPTDLSGRDPVLLDHRAYYTHVGVVEPRSLYVGACGRKALCLSSLEEGGDGSSHRLRSETKPRDLSWMFLRDDSPGWRTQPYGFWALYDRDGKVEDVTFSLGNMVFRAERVTSKAWPGTLHLVVAPLDEFTGIVVTPPRGGPDGGMSTLYEPQDLQR